MNIILHRNSKSTLYQIASSAARESERICKGILLGANNIQIYCAQHHRMRRLILRRVYMLSSKRETLKTYKIKSIRINMMPAKRYLYICSKLSRLADRQSKILLLCQIYRIPLDNLVDLFSELALTFTLVYYHLSHIQKCKNEILYQPILHSCQDMIHSCEEYAWNCGRPADHRALMRRDIADEFRTIAEGINEILALTLVSEVIK